MQTKPTTGRRIVIGLATLVTVAFCAAVVAAASLIWPVGCGGDGGYPYVALASPSADYCALSNDGRMAPLFLLVFLSPVVLTPIAGLVAIVRGRFLPLFAGAMIAILLMVAVLMPMMMLEGHCTAEQRASLPARQCTTYN